MKPEITPLFTDAEVKRWIGIFHKKAEKKIYKMLISAGEEFVKYARKSGNYHNHTGNLRSSIGYVVVIDGEIVSENFEKQDVGSDGDEGLRKCKRLSRKLANIHHSGMTLIGMAGMEYAVYVEAMESKDVITAASIRAEEWMRKAINSVFKKYG